MLKEHRRNYVQFNQTQKKFKAKRYVIWYSNPVHFSEANFIPPWSILFLMLELASTCVKASHSTNTDWPLSKVNYLEFWNGMLWLLSIAKPRVHTSSAILATEYNIYCSLFLLRLFHMWKVRVLRVHSELECVWTLTRHFTHFSSEARIKIFIYYYNLSWYAFIQIPQPCEFQLKQ